MSCSLQAAQPGDITNKWELAQRMSGHEKAPEEILQALFTGIMLGVETGLKRKFEASMKERIWKQVSEEKLQILKNVFMLEFCEKILGGFSDEEAGAALEEHIRTGFIADISYSARIQTAYGCTKELIMEAVGNKAHSMVKEWLPQIVDVMKKEGIELS